MKLLLRIARPVGIPETRVPLQLATTANGQLWAPVPSGLATVAGGPSGPPPRSPLVSAVQIGTISRLMQPGDIIFERREWAISNIGLPGFWPHVALYIGNGAERKRFFDDPAVRSWVASMGQASDFESMLELRYPRVVEEGSTPTQFL